MYKFGKDKQGFQKYQCKHCKRQFILEKSSKISKGYPRCPVCHKATFVWHRYDTYIHFKCCDKKCNFAFKIPILPPDDLLTSPELKDKFSFKGFRYPPNIILISLTLYYDGYSSTRVIKRILKHVYNVSVSHVTVHNWTKIFASWFRFISDNFMPHLNLSSDEWHADETYVKIKGVDHYLWLILDSETRVIISFVLSPFRNSNQAYKLFFYSSNLTRASPKKIVTDRWDAYNEAIKNLYHHTIHHKYSAFSDDLNNNFIESFNKTFKAWYKTKKGFKNFKSALALITSFIYHYNFLRQHSSLNNLTPAIVAGAEYSDLDIEHWLLF